MSDYCEVCKKVVDNFFAHRNTPEHQTKLLLIRGIPAEIKQAGEKK